MAAIVSVNLTLLEGNVINALLEPTDFHLMVVNHVIVIVLEQKTTSAI